MRRMTLAMAVLIAVAVTPAAAHAGAVSVLAPASVAGTFPARDATFGPQQFDISADLAAAEDPADAAGASTRDACSPIVNASEVAGKIAMVDRGTCNFTVKVTHAQDAGALAVVVANNMPGPASDMGPVSDDPAFTIPSAMIAQDLGHQLRAALFTGPVRVRLLRDTTAPLLTLPGSKTADAVTPAGALVTYAVSATDNLDPSPAVSCVPGSGATFPIGATTVDCTATDAAGNSGTGSFVVSVRGAAAQLLALIDKTLAYLELPPLEAALRARLETAAAALVENNKPIACRALNLYIVAVRLSPPAALSSAEKSELVADATRIKSVVGCP